MRLRRLRDFILETRQRQGVNWYLTDRTSDLSNPGQVFSLFCYDENNRLVCEVEFIEERFGKKIPKAKLEEIAEARLACGINAAFKARPVPKKESNLTRLQLFNMYLEDWRKLGRLKFVASEGQSAS